jgi:hypothetical protein
LPCVEEPESCVGGSKRTAIWGMVVDVMLNDKRRWQFFLLALCTLSVALLIHLVLFFLTSTGTTGIALARVPGEPNFATIEVTSQAVERSGLHTGDIIDLRPMPPADRYRIFSVYQSVGESFTYYVIRGAHVSSVNIVAEKVPIRWQVFLGSAGLLWMALFAALLAWRCPENPQARILALLLVLWPISIQLDSNNWQTLWPRLDLALNEVGAALGVSIALLASYTLLFAPPQSWFRRALVWLSYTVAVVFAGLRIVQSLIPWLAPVVPANVLPDAFTMIFGALQYAFPVLCGIAAALALRGVDRTRFLWAFGPLALLYVASIAADGFWFLGWPQSALNIMLNLTVFFAPLGLTYSLLSRRVLDIGFVLNRAAVLSGVSIVTLVLFVLAEWALTKWLGNAGRGTNIAISAALALMLGSLRFVHGKVDHFVDTVIFRKRRRDEEAILRMAREAPYITDRATLLERLSGTLLSHAGASFVNVLVDDGRGHYGEIDENDAVLVSLRADHVPVDLHATQTSIEGEWAYPMIARGRLIGALVLGPKVSQESYAPDESSAIAQLALSVASALDILAVKDDGGSEAVLNAIEALSKKVTAVVAAIDTVR